MKHRGVLIGGIIGSALLLSACGGGGSPGAASSKDGPIKIANIATYESAVYSVPQVRTAVEAAVADVNNAGGIDGRALEVSFCNDKFDANEASACAQRAVDSGAVAIVGGVSAHGAAITPILQAARIPFVGPPGVDPIVEGTDEIFFPINGAGTVPMFGIGHLAATLGGPNVVIVASDSGVASIGAGLAAKAVTAAGGKSNMVLAPLNAPDYAPTAASVLAYNPDGIAFNGGSGDAVRVVTALRQAGYRGVIVTLSSVASHDAIKALGDNAENLYLSSRGVSALDTSNALVAKFHEQMTAINPNAVIDDVALNAWMSVRLFAEALKGKEVTNGGSVIDALQSITTPIDQGGVYPPYAGILDPAPNPEFPRISAFESMTLVIKDGSVISEGGFYNPLKD